MSDLKHQDLEDLKKTRTDCLRYIRKAKGKINTLKQTVSGQNHRLDWIQYYIEIREKEEARDKRIQLQKNGGIHRPYWEVIGIAKDE